MADIRIVRYVLSGDSRGAVRAMEETAVASENTGKAVSQSGRNVEKSLSKTEKGARRMHGAIGGLMGTLGLGGLVFGMGDAVKAGINLQDQQAQLRQALNATHIAGAGMFDMLTKAAEQSSTHGGFTTEEELGGMTQLVRLTGSASKAITLNREAVMLARGAHEDYATALNQVERVQTGQVGRLQKLLGIIIPQNKATAQLTVNYQRQSQAIRQLYAGNKPAQDEALNRLRLEYDAQLRQAQAQNKVATAAAANSAIIHKFGGSVQQYNRTTAGSVSNARNSFHLLSEEIGTDLLPAVTTLVGWMGRNRTVVLAAAVGLGGLALAVKVAGFAIKTFEGETTLATVATKVWAGVTKAAAAAQWLLNFAMDDNPIGVVIIAIGALIAIVLIVTGHFKDFERIVSGVWNWLKGAVVDVVHFVGKHWKLLAVILAGPLAPIVLLITHLRQVIGLVRQAVNLPGKVLHGVGGAISSVGHFLGFAAGGIVPAYAAGGMFVPRGTDTVPAMLTPGEAVLRRAAVQSLGVDTVRHLNETGQMPGVGIEATTTPIYLDGRVIAEVVTHYVLKRSARQS